MALSGNQLTRIEVLGTPGRAYAGITAKAEWVIAVAPARRTITVNGVSRTITVNGVSEIITVN